MSFDQYDLITAVLPKATRPGENARDMLSHFFEAVVCSCMSVVFFGLGIGKATQPHIHTYHLETIATSQVWATERFQMMLKQSREQHPTPRILTRVLQPLLPHLRRKHHQEVEVPFPWTL